MNVWSLCRKEVITVAASTSVRDAAVAMRADHVGTVIVVAENESSAPPLGIVTDRDLVVEIIAEGVDPSDVAVADVMSRPCVTVNVDADVTGAITTLSENLVRRAAVTDNQGVVVGMFSVSDALGYLAQISGELAALSAGQGERERRTRPGHRDLAAT